MRNKNVIRQWKLLRTLDAMRRGATVTELARELKVSTRTVWRDVAALQEAGFPLTSERDDRRTRWMMAAPPFRGLADLGLSMMELCSLYLGRSLVSTLTGDPFAAGLAALSRKIERKLPPRLRGFLDSIPNLLQVKVAGLKRPAEASYAEHLARLLEAAWERRACQMRYYSVSSARAKSYVVHPYRLAYANGGMYLLAWVTEYGEIRTFAIDRIERLTVLDERFEPRVQLPADVFTNSIGVIRGRPERVVIVFAPRIARYVRERSWHASQELTDLPDGSVRMTLHVSVDATLRAWILGFGALARVESPHRLAQEILEHLEAARDVYAPRLELAVPSRVFDHPLLPGFGERGIEPPPSPSPRLS
jgi:proteasome accessory factor B